MTDRNLRRSAIVGLVITAVLTFLTVSIGGLKLFSSQWTLHAQFASASGLEPGAPVRVAGIRVGNVSTVERDVAAKHVDVTMKISSEVQVTREAHAAIKLRSLLGAKYVHIDDPGRGGPLADGDTLELANTTVTADMDELMQSIGEFAGPIDVDAINAFVANAGEAIGGHGKELGDLITEARHLAEVLEERADDLDRLVVASERLLGAVDSRRDELAVSIEELATVFDTLAQRRRDLEGLVTGVAGLSEQLTPLLDENEAELASILGDLETVTGVLDEQRDRIGLALEQLPIIAERFVNVTKDGPWVNIYFVGIVPGPFVANPVLVGEDGGLPTAWFDPPAEDPPEQKVGDTRIDFEDEGPREPPQDYPGGP